MRKWSRDVVEIAAGDRPPEPRWDDREAVDWPVRISMPADDGGSTDLRFDSRLTYARWLQQLVDDFTDRYGTLSAPTTNSAIGDGR